MSTRTSKTSLATPWSESAKTNITGYPSTTCSRSDVTKNRPATRKTPLIDTSSLTGTLSPTPSLVSPICLAKQSTSGQNITGKSTDFESKPTKSLATLSKSTAIRTVPSDTDSPKPGLNVTPSTSAKIQHYSGEGCSPSSTVTKPSSKTEKKNSSMSVTPRKSNDKNDANSDRTPRFV
ncbi:hypothetical protein SNE40_018338 [Patella caerulea]|uniref:Uncharacterized protein n=1 Tax=Patella caerulea TaxID=87958 RepID=A0AAN8J7F4_PATCE